MAREAALIKLSIWADGDFRDLSPNAKLLYFTLLTSRSLSYAGVTDWRPVRIATRTGLSVDEVVAAASEMVERLYLVVDDSTEEALIRSFMRNDGLMKQPKMASAMAAAYEDAESPALRGVIVHELKRLHEDFPKLNGWHSERALELLGYRSVDPSSYPLGKGIGNPSAYPSGKGSGKGSPTPSPSPTPISKELSMPRNSTTSDDPEPVEPEPTTRHKPRRGTRIPEGFTVTDDMKAWARSNTPSINGHIETANFVDYWQSKAGKDAVKVDWVATWRTWMRNAEQRAPRKLHAVASNGQPVPKFDMPVPPAGMTGAEELEWIKGKRREHYARYGTTPPGDSA